MVELKFTFGLKLLGLTVAVLIFFIIASLCINMVSPNDGGRTRFIACNKPNDTYCMGLEGCLHWDKKKTSLMYLWHQWTAIRCHKCEAELLNFQRMSSLYRVRERDRVRERRIREADRHFVCGQRFSRRCCSSGVVLESRDAERGVQDDRRSASFEMAPSRQHVSCKLTLESVPVCGQSDCQPTTPSVLELSCDLYSAGIFKQTTTTAL